MTVRDVLSGAILAGVADLRRRAGLLDRINVFPVVDADTGTNMLRTVEALADAFGRGDPDPSRAVLLGARGNSGVILAQFLVGLLDRLWSMEDLDAARLRAAISHGRDLARCAVSDPVEGTILTVMDDLSGLLATNGIADLESHAGLESDLAAAVARTPELMPRLAAAGVVDSGALGFHVLACGLTLALPWLGGDRRAEDAIRGRRAGETGAPLAGIADRIDPVFLATIAEQGTDRRYCVDVVIELSGPAPENLAARFLGVGGSVDAVTRDGLVKLHVHADDPEAVREVAAAIGRVARCEAEDMTAGLIREGDGSGAPAAPVRVRVLGDSSMSLARETAAPLGVVRFENYVDVGGRMVRDGDLDLPSLFGRMRGGQVFRTAQTSAAEARGLIDRELSRAGHLVYLAVGRAYTGTQDLVRRVIAEHPGRERIAVVDTRAASGQQGVAVLATARCAAADADPDDVAAYAATQAADAREYLVLDSLAYLSRTGRVGKIKAALAGAFGVKPVVGHGGDGAITHARVRSHEEALAFIGERLAAHPGNGPLLVLLEHTDNRDWLDEVRTRLAAALPSDTEFVTAPLSSTSSVHMGPGTWGVAVTRCSGRE
jgi:DegV family protein with EDD domain